MNIFGSYPIARKYILSSTPFGRICKCKKINFIFNLVYSSLDTQCNPKLWQRVGNHLTLVESRLHFQPPNYYSTTIQHISYYIVTNETALKVKLDS